MNIPCHHGVKMALVITGSTGSSILLLRQTLTQTAFIVCFRGLDVNAILYCPWFGVP